MGEFNFFARNNPFRTQQREPIHVATARKIFIPQERIRGGGTIRFSSARVNENNAGADQENPGVNPGIIWYDLESGPLGTGFLSIYFAAGGLQVGDATATGTPSAGAKLRVGTSNTYLEIKHNTIDTTSGNNLTISDGGTQIWPMDTEKVELGADVANISNAGVNIISLSLTSGTWLILSSIYFLNKVTTEASVATAQLIDTTNSVKIAHGTVTLDPVNATYDNNPYGSVFLGAIYNFAGTFTCQLRAFCVSADDTVDARFQADGAGALHTPATWIHAVRIGRG